jgi:MarR family transcriptional regulator, transcriptional regulator for hemolysin
MRHAVDSDLLSLLDDVVHRMHERADQLAQGRGITHAQWVVLVALARRPGLSQIALASRLSLEPIAIARLIDRLEWRGLVERRSDPQDRQMRRFGLTSAATQILRDFSKHRGELQREITMGLDPATLVVVTNSLMIMKANVITDQPDLCDREDEALAPTH